MDFFHRHRSIEARGGLVGFVSCILALAPHVAAHRLGRRSGKRFLRQLLAQVQLPAVGHSRQPPLRFRPEQLALEPLELAFDVGVIGRQGDELVAQLRVLLFQLSDPKRR